MSLTTPTTQQINDNIIAQLEAALNQSIPLLPKSFLRVLARALSGVFILLYKYVGFMHLQQFVRYASFRETTINGVRLIPLVEWGRLIGVGDPTAATSAELLVSVSVEGAGESVLPIGVPLVDSRGNIYLTAESVTLDTTTVTVRLRASTAGSAANQQVGATLSFANPLADVARDVTVSSVVVTGADAESGQAYRQRVIDRFQKRPQGGAYADYEQWGEETEGIVNVFPYTSPFPGQVDLYVEATPASSGSADGIPTTAQLQAVLDNVELPTRRPAGALVNAFPIERVEFAVIVNGVDVVDIASVREQITAAVLEYFAARDPYIVGLSVLPRRDRVTRSALGGVVDDVVSARGGVFTGVRLLLNGEDIDIYTLGVGQKAKTSGVTFA